MNKAVKYTIDYVIEMYPDRPPYAEFLPLCSFPGFGCGWEEESCLQNSTKLAVCLPNVLQFHCVYVRNSITSKNLHQISSPASFQC